MASDLQERKERSEMKRKGEKGWGEERRGEDRREGERKRRRVGIKRKGRTGGRSGRRRCRVAAPIVKRNFFWSFGDPAVNTDRRRCL